MQNTFQNDILKSGYIHRPLRLNEEDSFEARYKNSEIQKQEVLFSPKTETSLWKHRNRGEAYIENGELILTATHRYESWPEGAPEDGDYTNFGQVTTYRSFEHVNFEAFNRIYFEVKPICPGMVNPHIMLSIQNDGKIKVPDIYNREGYHTANLKNNEWNECFVEISDLPRDAITEIAFSVLLNGQDLGTLENMTFLIRKIEIQKVKHSSLSKGWIPQNSEIIYSFNGYHQNGEKIAFMRPNHASVFELIDASSNEVVFTKEIQKIKTYIGEFQLIDFSEWKQTGKYYIKVNQIKTEEFIIGDYQKRWHDSIYRSLNFIFTERCGCPVLGKHGTCHQDIIAKHNGVSMIFNGGWHDAGDVSQQLVQSGEVTQALFEMSQIVNDEQLSLRLEEEAFWGFDFILKTRFGDGYRATSAGITRWSDNLIGNMDDTVARVHNNAYENFLLSGIEADAALSMKNHHPLKAKAIQVAKEDFQFALEEFDKHGFQHEPVFWEHTYNMSKSLFLATMVYTSSLLYKLTSDKQYATYATQWATQLLECQETKGIKLFDQTILKGFFYRDESHKVVQHFNHQAREHMYAKALDMLLEAHVCDENQQIYEESLKSYGDYLKYLMNFTKPYPMIASGVYLDDENKDKESFQRQHLLIGDEAYESYNEQLKQGHQISEHLYVKKFPVWFSFRGNNGIILSMGKSASLIGKRLHDQELLKIAEGQLQWMVGMNPFGQSLVYGEGHHFAQQYSVLTGEMVGEMPVGVQTFENEDEPYWPQLNNATYKEVWVGLAGKWLDILVDLYKIEEEK